MSVHHVGIETKCTAGRLLCRLARGTVLEIAALVLAAF